MTSVFSKKPAYKFGSRRAVPFSSRKDVDENGEPRVAPEVVPPTYEQVWSKLLGWQTRRDHSCNELEAKLRQFGAEAEHIERALARLTELGLQSDDRFADALVRTQLARGRGQRAIKQTLQQRGIGADHTALQTQTADTDWVLHAQETLQRRFGTSPPADQKAKARQVRFLQYRGFSLGQALSAINSQTSDDIDYEFDE